MENKQNQNLFAFVLGRETELSLLELKAVLERFGFGFCESKNHPERAEEASVSRTDVPCYTIISVTDNIAIIKVEHDKLKVESRKFESEDLMKKVIEVLGGTVKIFKLSKINSSNMAKEISGFIFGAKKEISTKVDFGISDYSGGNFGINNLGLEIKNLLKPDLKSRFIFVKEGRELSSIVSEANKLDGKGIEVGVFKCHSECNEESRDPHRVTSQTSTKSQDDKIILGQLVALSDPFAWSRRDYGKPEGDKYSGMLPPKLARIMINLTISNENQTIVDPFCGSGNIPIEAAVLGLDVIASDLTEKAVNDTKSNLDWLKTKSDSNKEVFRTDATKDNFLESLSTREAVIVTEPYLGEPKKFKPSKAATLGEFNKLRNEYIGFLENLANLLKAKSYKLSAVCIVFPRVESSDNGQVSLWSESVDEIKNLGYTLLRPPLVYGRDYQVVKREIVFLKLT